MNRLQEKLDFLLEKYSVDTKAVLKDGKTVVIGGMELPILSHRSERRFVELKNIVNNGTLVGVSVMRVARIIEKGSDIYEALYRELDLVQYILQRSIKSIMVMENDNVMNAIATTEDGVVCTIEISATLKAGEIPKDKHEIISQRGIACDVVVDAQLKQDSIYVFGAENKKYTDVDFELFGLSIEEIAVVRAAFAVAQKLNFDELKAIDENLCKLVEMAKKSAENGEREVM
ncbi:MAG: hypothetical protein IKA09_04485 [Lachnospiraceae bacterium]|nr:hypothetical protein [Lachnospiraceae bacterium]